MTDDEKIRIERNNFTRYYLHMSAEEQRDADCYNPMAGVHFSMPKGNSAIELAKVVAELGLKTNY